MQDHETERIRYRDMSAWTVRNQVETTVPAAARDDLGLDGDQQVAFIPCHDDGTLLFTIGLSADGSRSNHRKLKGRPDSDQITLRVPAVLAAATGLLAHVTEGSDGTLRFSRPSDDATRLFLTPQPPLALPEVPANGDGDDAAVEPMDKELFDHPSAYDVQLDARFVRALGLEDDDPVAWTLARDDESLVLVGDFDRDRIPDADAPNVRRVDTHPSGTEASPTEQFRLYLPSALVESLDWADATLRFALDGQRLVVRPTDNSPE